MTNILAVLAAANDVHFFRNMSRTSKQLMALVAIAIPVLLVIRSSVKARQWVFAVGLVLLLVLLASGVGRHT